MTAVALEPSISALIQMAIAEDIGSGDLTSQYFIPKDAVNRARIFAKSEGIASGLNVAIACFQQIDPDLTVHATLQDGQPFQYGDTLLQITGRTSSILTGERVALNFLQRLCAIATKTRSYTQLIEGTGVQILDTRKTTPGWRLLEKQAVRHGGGTNHRMGLYDMVMVKDNHLLAESEHETLQQAIDAVKAKHPEVRIELEADTLEQVNRFLTLRNVDVILLDNMDNATMAQAVRMGSQRVQFEASGGITHERLTDIAQTGVDFISIGALTHAITSLDLSLELLAD